MTEFNVAAALGRFSWQWPIATSRGAERRRREPDWLTLGQAAKYLGVAQSTIRKWSDQGRVPAFYTPGGHRRYRRADLDRFLERSGPGARRAGAARPSSSSTTTTAMREYVRASLELEGYYVREAGNAEEGLAALEGEQQPQLILLDVMMPRRRRLGDAPRIQERHGVDPRDHVQRPGRRAVRARAPRSAARPLRRQAVRSAAADRPREADPPRLGARARSRRAAEPRRSMRSSISGSSGGSSTIARSRSTRSSSGSRTSAASASSGSRSPCRDAFCSGGRSSSPLVVIAYFAVGCDRRRGQARGRRHRPIADPLVRSPTTPSFPSGHAATSFACAATLAQLRAAPRRGRALRPRRRDRVLARLRRRALPARRARGRRARTRRRYSSSAASQ